MVFLDTAKDGFSLTLHHVAPGFDPEGTLTCDMANLWTTYAEIATMLHLDSAPKGILACNMATLWTANAEIQTVLRPDSNVPRRHTPSLRQGHHRFFQGDIPQLLSSFSRLMAQAYSFCLNVLVKPAKPAAVPVCKRINQRVNLFFYGPTVMSPSWSAAR